MASKESVQAKKLYLEGMAPVEIANKLGKPLATISSWKRRHKWDDAEGATPATPKRNVAPKPQRNATPKPIDEQLVDAVEENTKLTDAQKAFCLHYAKTFNATASYLRAYPNCSYDTARNNGSVLLAKDCIRAEIQRLKKMRNLHLMASGDDVVERMMQIAFADITDYLEFGRVEVGVMGAFGPVMVDVTDAEGNVTKAPLTKTVNDVRFKESTEVDGTLLLEVKQGKDGASIKLADRMKALHWLAGYFELNPSDVHRREYDRRRLELESLKIAVSQGGSADQGTPDDGFLAALNADAKTMWSGDTPDDSQEGWVADNELDES